MTSFLKIIYNLIKSLLSGISYIIPISKKILVFSSFPDYSDNAYAFYKYLTLTRDSSYILIWLISDKTTVKSTISTITKENVKAKIYYRFTILGFWYFYRSRYVLCTHGLFSFISLKQRNKIVNLWHGMPLKAIGSMDPSNKGFNKTKADYLIAPSPLFQEIMSKCFNNINRDKIFITGLPRNDLMFEETDFYKKNNIIKEKYRKIGIWLPTYRSSINSELRTDGNYELGRISFLDSGQLMKLSETLKTNNDFLIIKLHPLDILQKYSFIDYSNIIIVKQKYFTSQLYPLLGSTDYLLTDYSSVWVDYDILEKPIGFVMNDIKEYRLSRGFTIDNMEKILPGPVIADLNDLICFISKPEKTNVNKNNMFNIYKDGQSSQRLAKMLKL